MPEGFRVHMPRLLRQRIGAPLARRFVPTRHDNRALRHQGIQRRLRPACLAGKTLDTPKRVDRDLIRAGNQFSRLNVELRVFADQDKMMNHQRGVILRQRRDHQRP